MYAGEILEGIHSRYQLPLRRKEHELQWVLPVARQRFGQLVAIFRTLVHIVDDDGGANKPLVEPSDHVTIREQTCPQVRTAGSTALVIRRSPRDEGQDRPVSAACVRQD